MDLTEQIRIEKQELKKNTESVEMHFDGFALLIFLKGHALFSVDHTDFAIGSGESLLLRPEPGYVVSCQEACKYIQIIFSEESFFHACLAVVKGCPLLAKFFLQNHNNIVMNYLHFQTGKEDISLIGQKMLLEYQNRDSYYEAVTLCELMTLLLTLSRSCWVDASLSAHQDNLVLQNMLEYIVSHSEDISLQTMADVFHFHPNSVSAILKRGTGKSFQQLLEQTRMSRASGLLGNMTVQEAAEACGYKNMSNFYTRFQKYYGMTPGEYAQKKLQMNGQEDER